MFHSHPPTPPTPPPPPHLPPIGIARTIRYLVLGIKHLTLEKGKQSECTDDDWTDLCPLILYFILNGLATAINLMTFIGWIRFAKGDDHDDDDHDDDVR